jgi:hypothetical protein
VSNSSFVFVIAHSAQFSTALSICL